MTIPTALARDSNRARPLAIPRTVTAFVLVPVIALVATAAAWLRLSPMTRGTLWAEDLWVFLGNGLSWHTVPAALVTPYGGYLQTVPRVLAALVAHLVPISHWAPAIALAACAVVGVVTAVVFVCASQILGSRWLAIMVAAITVLVPLGSHEVLGDLANVHWFVVWMTPWVLLYRPATRWGAIILAAILFLGALSEITIVLFLPLLAWRWRDRSLWVVRIPFVVACVAEGFAELAAPRAQAVGPQLTFGDFFQGYLVNAVLTIVSPIRTDVGVLLHNQGIVLAIVLVALAAALATYVLVRGDARQRILAVVVVIVSPGLFGLALKLNPAGSYAYAHLSAAALSDPWLVRYGVVPSMFLLALVPLAAAVYATRHADTRRRTIVVAAAAIILAVPLLAHAAPTPDQLRANGPAFAPQVAASLNACRASGAPQTFLAAPANEHLTLTCALLESFAR